MEFSDKLLLLVWLFIMGGVLISTMIILQSLGSIGYLLDHIEKTVEHETSFRLEKYSRKIAKEQYAIKMEAERKKRSEALLSMPLMMEKPKDRK